MTEPKTSTNTGASHHQLAWLDQLAFELFMSSGRNQLMQCIWLYDRNINIDALKHTVERLAAMHFNRLIEPSPLPWGRPRWLKPADKPTISGINAAMRPRSHLVQWANEQTHAPIHPVTGPPWRISLQRFEDGSSAISIVGSHLVLDGIGALRAIEAAVTGKTIPNPYITRGTRSWITRCALDMRQTIADAPDILAAIVKFLQTSRRKSITDAVSASRRSPKAAHSKSEYVELPFVAVTVKIRDWEACAQRLGGHANTLLPAFVATLASHLGRRRSSDGCVSLIVPVNRRHGLDDERALAIEFHTLVLDPSKLTTHLQPVNILLKSLLRRVNEKQTDPLKSILPAIAWMPRKFILSIVNRLFNYAENLPVSCSDLGILPDGLTRIDGAACVRVLTRAVDVNVTRKDLERSHGHLVVVVSRYDTNISLCIEAWQDKPSTTTQEALSRLTQLTLDEFRLEATLEA